MSHGFKRFVFVPIFTDFTVISSFDECLQLLVSGHLTEKWYQASKTSTHFEFGILCFDLTLFCRPTIDKNCLLLFFRRVTGCCYHLPKIWRIFDEFGFFRQDLSSFYLRKETSQFWPTRARTRNPKLLIVLRGQKGGQFVSSANSEVSAEF